MEIDKVEKAMVFEAMKKKYGIKDENEIHSLGYFFVEGFKPKTREIFISMNMKMFRAIFNRDRTEVLYLIQYDQNNSNGILAFATDKDGNFVQPTNDGEVSQASQASSPLKCEGAFLN